MSDESRTWVVLVNFNGTDDTRKCLASLAGQPAHVVVIDNASKQDDCAALRAEYPWADIVRSEVNGGWAGGNNRGIEHALARGGESFILLNNDTVVRADFVSQLVAAAAAHPDYGVLGPVIRFLDEPDKIQTRGTAFNKPGRPGFFTVIDVEPTNATPPTVVPIDIVNGCCLMTRKAVTDAIGLIDERYFLIHEESDFCLRASAAGFRCGAIAVDPVRHKGSSSFKREGQKLQRYYDARNLIPLLRRHGGRKDGRSRFAGWKAYAKYVYYRYALEREAKTPAAAAVLEGVYDGLAGRVGPKTDKTRWGLWWLRTLVGLAWRVKG